MLFTLDKLMVPLIRLKGARGPSHDVPEEHGDRQRRPSETETMTTLANQHARLIGAFHNDAPFKNLDTRIINRVVCRDRLAVNVFCQGNNDITLLTFGTQKIFGAKP